MAKVKYELRALRKLGIDFRLIHKMTGINLTTLERYASGDVPRGDHLGIIKVFASQYGGSQNIETFKQLCRLEARVKRLEQWRQLRLKRLIKFPKITVRKGGELNQDDALNLSKEGCE